ncbi:conserved exported hypothetical protein [Verrucomicrobia bacterium]|nr:conserved exported hypothetical protein [Verrucomicrobiota bacterium]
MNSGTALRRVSRFSVGLSLLGLTSCSAYKVPTTAYGPRASDPFYQVRLKAVQSSIYHYVPRKTEQLRALDLRWLSWCVAGNDDDGIFGEYSGKTPYSTNINFGVFCSWSILRNPFHNFDCYVIGTARWRNHYNLSVLDLGGGKPARVFSNAANWPKGADPFFDFGFNDFKPYLKWNPWIVDFFLGWRKNGSFEIKLRPDLHKRRARPTGS